ncbi:hypothetical protein CERZMDRAFT_85669 [Cercospora zeae-maydis SCOH1-5]|uniref:Uncharacterized protein n=1 Tax=Cercospora zeae-maydis SCOH1-5 TaxID=717836 RepID=A0A6A6FCI8_9PEZI|nr:hypothetical protein CERZMDRAFT_85669 [Cercospora zeae-maydis SCOH1-5]
MSTDEHGVGREGMSGHGEQQDNGSADDGRDAVTARNTKERPRLLDHGHAAIESREMEDLGTALEVDHMILDFLLFQAINACLDDKRAATEKEHRLDFQACLTQVDQFLQLFRTRYPAYRPDPELRFRQLLLQLVVLVTQRFRRCSATPSKSSLTTLRAVNQARARSWIGHASRLPTADYDVRPFDEALPISPGELEENRSLMLGALGIPAEDDAYEDSFYGTSDCVTLLDLLPLFMRVSAACHTMFACPPTEKWMNLAAAWMLHACLEQYLVFGASGSDAIDEAFAWGPAQQRGMSMEEDREEEGHAMQQDKPQDPFCLGLDDEHFEMWYPIRSRALDTILSSEKQYWKDVASHLAAVWDKSFPAQMEKEITEFLSSLAECIAQPVLVQLQRGQLQGMTISETQSFIRSCGVDVAEIFASIDGPG